MSEVFALLARNPNYRRLWLAQVVSEVGDFFNNVAVLALVMESSGSGVVVSGVLLARAFASIAAGPLAGVLLDRMDRKRIMILSDLVRAGIAAAFLITVFKPSPWLLYLLSALLMFASPFFTSGRNAILPALARGEQLRVANALTQTTQWATQSAGALLGGQAAARWGYAWSFLLNSLSFLVSAAAVACLRVPEGFRPAAHESQPQGELRPWREYYAGLRYLRSIPLIFGIAMMTVGWAIGGGAAQVLFALFGGRVFNRGAGGIGALWGFAGLGLLAGGLLGHALGRRLDFRAYKRTVAVAYLSHGLTYIAFSLTKNFTAALALILFSRVGMSVSSVLNNFYLLRYTRDEFRGRVFATIETLRWAVMATSFALTGIVSARISPRAIGAVAGALGALTGLGWAWADMRGKLPLPEEAPDKHH